MIKKISAREIYKKKVVGDNSTLSQRLSDKVASIYGSWAFVTFQTIVFILWITCNSIPGFIHWDEPPFGQLNLILSFIAGYTGSFLQMAANRQALRDRLLFEHDYETDVKAEKEIEKIQEDVSEIKKDLEMLINKLK